MATLSNVSGYVEVVNSTATRFTNAVQGDMTIYTDCNIQSIHLGTGQGSNSMIRIGERSVLTTGINLTTGSNATALSNIRDFSGTFPTLSNTGTFNVVSNAPNTTLSAFGSIDITNGYYTFSNNGSLFPNSNIAHSNIFSTDFAIESWVYYTATPSAVNVYLIGAMEPTGGLNYWSFGVNSNRQIGLYAYANNATNSTLITQCNVVPLNSWAHIGATYCNVTKAASLWVNGVAQSNLLVTGGAVWNIPSVASTSASNTGISHVGPSLSYLCLGRYTNCNNSALIHDFRMTMGTAAITTALPSPIVTGTRLMLRAGLITTRPVVPFTIGSTGFVGVGTSNPQYTLDVAGDINTTGNIYAGTANNPMTISAGNLGMFRNRIINGDMRFDQRAIGTIANTTAWQYIIDRWQSILAITGMNASRISLTTSDTPYNQGFMYALQFTAPTSTLTVLQQRIELFNCIDMLFAQKTVSFWAKSTSAQTLTVYQRLTPTGDTTTTTAGTEYLNASMVDVNVSLTTSWQYYTATFPAVASTTINMTNGMNQGMRLAFGITPTASTTVQITGVQLERGNIATPFEFRPFPIELQLCQRYYEKSFDLATTPAANVATNCLLLTTSVTSASLCSGYIYFKMPKRAATGTYGLYNPFSAVGVNTSLRVPNGSTEVNIALGNTAIAVTGLTVSMSNATAFAYHAHYVVDSEV